MKTDAAAFGKPHVGARSVVGDLLRAGALFVLYALLAAAVSAGWTQGADEAILRAIPRGGVVDHLVGDATGLGSGAVLGAVCLIAIAVLWVKRQRLAAAHLLVMYALASIVDPLGKHLLNRERPTVVPHLVATHSSSFPSGHALMTTAIIATLGLIVVRRIADPAVRRVITIAAIALVAIVVMSRMYLGVHYPSDVLGGVLFGAGMALVLDAGVLVLSNRLRR